MFLSAFIWKIMSIQTKISNIYSTLRSATRPKEANYAWHHFIGHWLLQQVKQSPHHQHTQKHAKKKKKEQKIHTIHTHANCYCYKNNQATRKMNLRYYAIALPILGTKNGYMIEIPWLYFRYLQPFFIRIPIWIARGI